MQPRDPAFDIGQTHGLLLRNDNRVHAASDRLGWTSAYASAQREQPYEAHYPGVRDHLIVLHRDGPVGVAQVLGSNRRHCSVPPGGLFILPGGTDFGVHLEGQLETVHVYVRDAVLRDIAAETVSGDPDHVCLVPRLGEQDSLIEQLVLGLRAALDPGDPGHNIYADSLSRALAAQLLRAHSSCTSSEPRPCGRLSRVQLARARAVMQANLPHPFSVRDLAEAVGISPSHFARGFKASTGLPPHGYLVRLRIERAKTLLHDTDLPIVEVALSCGFAHQEHLTRAFGRWLGTTPARYRRQRRT